ncbi:MAG: hypothetical protein JXP34_23995 [Planctomycetes bacterium]|nr:hypothetical protein [Planctomycetota bacterium]
MRRGAILSGLSILAAGLAPAADPAIDLPEWSPPAGAEGQTFALGTGEVRVWGRGREAPRAYFDEFLPALFERTLAFEDLDLAGGAIEWIFTGDEGGFTIRIEDGRVRAAQRFYDSFGLSERDGDTARAGRHPERSWFEREASFRGAARGVTVRLDHRLGLAVALNGREVLRQTCLFDVAQHQLRLIGKGGGRGMLIVPAARDVEVRIDPRRLRQTIIGFGGIATPTAYAELSDEGKRRWWEIVCAYNLLIQREYPIGTRLRPAMDNWDRLSDATPHYYGDNFPNGEISDFAYIRTLRRLGGKVWFEFWTLPSWATRDWTDSDGKVHRGVADPGAYARAMVAYCTASRERAGAPPDVVGIQNEVGQPPAVWHAMTRALREALDAAGFRAVRIHMSDAGTLAGGIARARAFRSDEETWKTIDFAASHMYDYQDAFQDPDGYDAKLRAWREGIGGKPFLSTELCINAPRYQRKTYRLALLMGELYHKNLVIADAAAVLYCWTLLNVVQPTYGATRSLCVPDRSHGFLPAASSHQLRVFGAFSRRVREGMARVEASSTCADLLASAFEGADGARTVILLNRALTPARVSVAGASGRFSWLERVDPYRENEISPSPDPCPAGATEVVVPPGAIATLSTVPLGKRPEGFAMEAPAGRGLTRPLRDKTLVAWVHLAGTDQRGGSALTLMEGEDFDAIVFGERSPGRWMAGSDFFRRTQGEKEQAASPPEVADEKTCVQIAIVYEGDRIRIYRDDAPYAAYRVAKPRAFGPETSVLIGLRYLASMGPIGYLHGEVEEARIYDVALDPKTIATLAPNRASDPPPIACFPFEDGSIADARGTFPPGTLAGGARILNGRLVLDGTDAYFVSGPPDDEDQAMFYVPLRRDTGRMWDTWLFWRDGTYYLFYLASSGPSWDNISMATSEDGVHWKERGPILRKADGVTWMGTGSTWRSPDFEKDGKYILNFSEWRGDRQTIFFAESTDLLRWTRLGNEVEFVQDARWYKPKGRWDCIYAIPRDGGGFYGYWTADPEGRPGVGFGESADGVRWEALEPPLFLDGAPHGEAGAVEKLGDPIADPRYYLMLGSGGDMLALVADKPEGPFRPAKKNRVLLHAGPTYFARFFPTSPGGVLVNHHAIAKNGKVYFGLLKTARVDAEGTLRLGWWKGNERLKHRRIDVPALRRAEGSGSPMFDGEFPAGDGIILEGTLSLPADASPDPRGIRIETADGEATTILVDRRAVTTIGSIRADREIDPGETVRFRLVLKRWLLEFYIDDILMECYSLPARATGRLGIVGPSGALGRIEAWR